MKKIYIFVVAILVFSVIYLNTKDNLGNGYKYNDLGFDYWQTIVNKRGEVIPSKVVEFHANSSYIIAVRIIIDMYECYDKNTVTFTPENNIALPFISRKKLQYWLIDKKRNIAYFSEHKNKVEKKIKDLKLSLKFDNKDYKNNSYMNGKEGKLNSEYTCILTNNPLENRNLNQTVDLDK